MKEEEEDAVILLWGEWSSNNQTSRDVCQASLLTCALSIVYSITKMMRPKITVTAMIFG